MVNEIEEAFDVYCSKFPGRAHDFVDFKAGYVLGGERWKKCNTCIHWGSIAKWPISSCENEDSEKYTIETKRLETCDKWEGR